jgi:hypothetical protein
VKNTEVGGGGRRAEQLLHAGPALRVLVVLSFGGRAGGATSECGTEK